MSLSKTFREIVIKKTIEQLDSNAGEIFLDQQMKAAIGSMSNFEELSATLTKGDRRQLIDEVRKELQQHLRLLDRVCQEKRKFNSNLK